MPSEYVRHYWLDVMQQARVRVMLEQLPHLTRLGDTIPDEEYRRVKAILTRWEANLTAEIERKEANP